MEEKMLLALMKQNMEILKQNEILVKRLTNIESKTNKIDKNMVDGFNEIASIINKVNENSINGTKELIHARNFENITQNSNWLEDKSFTTGGWAIGYQGLYCLYRVLNEFRPKNILELGLGQSTKMIGQYAKNFGGGVSHTVIENDDAWIEFFERDSKLFNTTEIVKLDYAMTNYETRNSEIIQNVRVYDKFKETFSGCKFDLILVDAPWSGDMKNIGRIDILSIIPDCLEKSFIILVDDSQRDAEKKMINELREILTERGMSGIIKDYQGIKKLTMICSPDNNFFTTM